MKNQIYEWDNLSQHTDWGHLTKVSTSFSFLPFVHWFSFVLAQRSVGESRTESPPCCSCKLQSDVMMGFLDTVAESLGLLLSLMVWNLHAMQYRFNISIWLTQRWLNVLLFVSDFWKKWIILVSESWSGIKSLVGHSPLLCPICKYSHDIRTVSSTMWILQLQNADSK